MASCAYYCPPIDPTLFVDIERNPGPLCSLLNYKIHPVANAQVAHRPLDFVVSNSNVSLVFHIPGISFFPFIV